MIKKNFKKREVDRPRTVLKVTKSINKTGRLKGMGRKNPEVLEGVCPHHIINMDGIPEPTIFSNDDEYCTCTLCGTKFPKKFYTNDEIKNIISEMDKINTNNESSSGNANADMMADFFCQLGDMLQKEKDRTAALREIADKKTIISNRQTSSMYGSWDQK